MAQNLISMAIEEAHSLLKELNLENIDIKIWVNTFSRLNEITHSILEGNAEQLFCEKWILEVFASVANEIGGCLITIKENGGIKCSIPDCFVHMLNILWQCFRYCQVAGTICTDDLEVSESLASLFKLSYQNIKVIMELIKTYSNQLFCNTIDILLDVTICLIKCSQVLADIDIMASVAVWKCIKHLYAIHKDKIMLNHSKFTLFNVCDIACKTLNSCFELIGKKDGDMIGKYQKVIRFFLGIVLLFTKDFKDVMTMEECSQVYNLMHLIQKLSLIETRNDYERIGCSQEYESINNTLLCVNDPLMKDFIEVNGSAPCVLGKLQSNKEDTKSENIECLMDLLNVLECLSEKTEFISPWMESSSICLDGVFEETSYCCIVDVLFSCVEHCSSSLFVGRKDYIVLDKSKCLKEASLYEMVLGSLCTFVSTLPSKYFEHLESIMLSNVLLGHKYCVLLATDLWCFISRWGKAELCLSHFIFLSKLLVRLHEAGSDNVSVNSVSHLVQRLFWLLEEYQHEQILLNFPISPTNIVIWKLFPWSHLNIPNKLDMCSEVVEIVLSLMELKEKKENDDHPIVCAIECLSSLLSDHDSDVNIAANVKHEITEHVIEFWSCFQNVDEDIEINESLVIAMLFLTSKLLPYFEGKCVYGVLSIVNNILQNTKNQVFQIQCTYFLTQLKDITFPAENESNCLCIISEMFQYLMNGDNWIVDDCSMKALQIFAEETVYSHALASFLPQSRKKGFSIYLRKEVSRNDMQNEKVLEIILQQPSNKNIDIPTEQKMTISEDKKTQIENAIDKMESDVREFDVLAREDSISPSCMLRVKAIISTLANSCTL